ncbi:MAG: NmrA family NAD(P)-binding protein [Oceanicaulis sp.]
MTSNGAKRPIGPSEPDSPILILGAGGRMGGAVLRACAMAGPVRAATRDPARHDGPGEAVAFNMEKQDTFGAAMAGCGGLFVMRPPRITAREPFEALARTARNHGVRRVVVGSLRGADRAPLPHRGMEEVFKGEGFVTTILRPADFMQNFETVHRDDIRRGEIRAPSGAGRSALIDVEDVGACAAAAFADPATAGRAYELTGPQALTMGEAAEIFTAALEHRVRHVSSDPVSYVVSDTRRGRDRMTAMVMAALYTAQRFGLAKAVTGDVEQLTGEAPGTLEDYVARNAQIWR